MHQKSVIFAIIDIFLIKYVTIVSIKRNGYRIHFGCMSKIDAIRIMNNSSLNEEAGS